MPSLGADMDAGRIVEWLVKPGAAVHRGDIVAVVDTDKADVDVEIFEDGVVEAILVPAGEKVAVGTPLARIATAGAAAPVAPAAAPVAPAVAPAAAPAVPSSEPAAVHSPIVRRHAAELGVDLAEVTGSGPDGAVTRADVERAARARGRTAPSAVPPATAPIEPAAAGGARVSPRARRLAAEAGVALPTLAGTGPGGVVTGADVEHAAATGTDVEHMAATGPAAGAATGPAEVGATATDRKAAMRRMIANRMARANREIPHYYLETRVDFSRAHEWLERENEVRPVESRLISAALLLKASALAARKVPDLNGFWVDDHAEPVADVHVGIVISLRGGGLVAPAIHSPGELALDDLMASLRDVVGRARAGRLRSSEMSDATITMTNIGEQGVDKVFGVIFPPQLAIVGFGAIREQPWAADGMVGARPVVVVTVAGDHRATDGATGARYLRAVDALLQEPEAL